MVAPLGCRTPFAIACVLSVAALPTSICPQAISNLRPSRQIHFVRPVIACLVMVYGIEFGRGTCAETDPLLIILPPCGFCDFIRRTACCAQRKAPVMLTPTTAAHCWKVRLSIGVAGTLVPALLNRTSRRPQDF